MTETLSAAPLIRGTEFIVNDQGVRMFGCCGQRALASAASSELDSNISTLGIYNSMIQHGWADPGGATTIGDLQLQAKLMNCEIASFVQYNEPWDGWLDWLDTQVDAGNPCVIEVAYGQALYDSISQQGENAVGLRYHFIAVLGTFSGGFSARAGKTLAPGFWCADGDSFAGNNDNAHGFAAENVLQYYTDTVMAAAHPCGGLALKGRAIKMAWTQQANGTGKDDAGHTCGNGFIKELLSSGDAVHDGLMSETELDKSTFLPLANGNVYFYDGAVHTNQGAQVAVKLYQMWEAAEKAAIPSAPPTATTSADPFEPKYNALKAAVEAAVANN